ncbi:MAG: hypothetical protein NT120_05165 [Candidatus Aenigmarchaeota archaeon]|nr:hypothetical protein [Candidatus Aenigmarchaeota archaeon]
MRKILLLPIFAIILISGCVNQDSTKPVMKIPHYTIYGTLTDFQQEGSLTKFFINQELSNCEINSSTFVFSAAAHPTSLQTADLIKGKKYLLDFSKINDSDGWRFYISDISYLDVIQRCDQTHDSDLIIDQKLEIIKGTFNVTSPNEQASSQVVPTIIPINQQTQIAVDLINKQDVPIKYKLLDFAIVDEIVAQPFLNWWENPSYEERLATAKINECKIEYNKEEQVIPASSRQPLNFTVTCSEPTTCKKSYESCDINNENCKTATVDKCQFYLWGQISFEDELGFEHTIPQKDAGVYRGIIKQLINIE